MAEDRLAVIIPSKTNKIDEKLIAWDDQYVITYIVAQEIQWMGILAIVRGAK